MTFSAPVEILRALEQMLLLAVQRLDVARPVLAVVALHRLAFVVAILVAVSVLGASVRDMLRDLQ